MFRLFGNRLNLKNKMHISTVIACISFETFEIRKSYKNFTLVYSNKVHERMYHLKSVEHCNSFFDPVEILVFS